MNDIIKNKLKSYSFWVSLASAILLLVQTIGRPLGLVIDESTYMSIVNSVLGVFVVLGIISHPAQNLLKNSTETNEEVIRGENNQFAKNEDIVIKNGGITTQKSCINAKNGGLVIDSKSNCDASKVDVDVDANNNLGLDSQQKIEKAKRDFMNSYK